MMNKNIYMGINSKPNETNVTKTISLKKKVCLRKTKITACHTDPLEVL